MSEAAARIRTIIRREGPITFDRFMQEALYGSGGFYERPPVGASGHFVTSPHVHPVFARLVGAAIEGLWVELGRPVPLRVIELGAGDGTMAREIIDGFGRGGIEIHYVAVERSPGAREALTARGIRAVERLAQIEPLAPRVVVANELLDNLPFRRVRQRDSELVELRIGLEGDRLVEVEGPCEPALARLAPTPDEGEEAVVPVGALEFVDELAARIRTGYALLIDYGSAGGPAGPVHAYREHRVLEDVLEDPGSSDVTAGVDLGAVAARWRERGLVAFEPISQRAALVALGFERWMRAELIRQGDLLNEDRGAEAVRTWEGRNRARLLVDPSALGRLRWLVLATSGLPEPPWLERARGATPPIDPSFSDG